MGRTVRIGLGLFVALALAACQGRVSDPENDVVNPGTAPPPHNDIVEAGADHGTQTTRLWIRYAEGGTPGEHKYWYVSVDGDTDPEVMVELRYPETDHYLVSDIAGLEQAITCAGFVPDAGFDGVDTVSLTVDTRCLFFYRAGDGTLRIQASSTQYRGSTDETSWTAPIARS